MSRPSVPPSTSGLPVTISGTGWPDLLGVGVHEPRHLALAGGHVGRRDVAVGPDDREDLRGVAAGHALQLVLRQPVGVAAHAALGAAERQAQQRALERHPHRQRRALAQRHAGRVAHAALHRAHRERVLHAVAGEALHLAVVAADGEVHDQRAPRLEQARAHVGLDPQQVGRARELVDGDPVELGAPFRAGRDQVGLGLEHLIPAARAPPLGVHRCQPKLHCPRWGACNRSCRWSSRSRQRGGHSLPAHVPRTSDGRAGALRGPDRRRRVARATEVAGERCACSAALPSPRTRPATVRRTRRGRTCSRSATATACPTHAGSRRASPCSRSPTSWAGEVLFTPPARPDGVVALTMDMFLDQGSIDPAVPRESRPTCWSGASTSSASAASTSRCPRAATIDFVTRSVEAGARLVYAPSAVMRHPTIDRGRSFLRKVWSTNRWAAARRAREGRLPSIAGSSDSCRCSASRWHGTRRCAGGPAPPPAPGGLRREHGLAPGPSRAARAVRGGGVHGRLRTAARLGARPQDGPRSRVIVIASRVGRLANRVLLFRI